MNLVIANILAEYPEALTEATTLAGITRKWQQQVVDEIEELRDAQRGSAFKTLLRIIDSVYTLATQILRQRFDPM